MQHPNIELTEKEERIFSVIIEAASWKKLSDVSIRVAGGWVRDKILGVFNDDIDVALGGINGVDFAMSVKEYLEFLQGKGKIDHQTNKIGVIMANPDQSKHLETATMTIFGIDMDFVNLRAEEVYTNDSRIPLTTNRFGTPLQDAMRRDFTINSLFYNLRTRKVEDYTNRGLPSLIHDKIIQTPIDPNITLHDDPLRVLRAVRFAVRYNFQLDPDLQNAAMSQSVKLALRKKVSRERVGKELEGMLTGKNAKPLKALELITQLTLPHSVFSYPDVSTNLTVVPKQSPEIINETWKESKDNLIILGKVLPAFKNRLILSSLKNTPPILLDTRMLHLATYLLPFFPMSVTNKKGKEQSLPQWMLKEGVKFKNKDVDIIGTHVNNLPEMQSLLQKHHQQLSNFAGISHTKAREIIDTDSNPKCMPSRLEAGLILRRLKDQWLTNLVLATISEVHRLCSNKNDILCEVRGKHFQDLLQSSFDLYTRILLLDLNECWKVRPLLDGKCMIQRLSLPRGPLVGVYLEEQARHMLLFPQISQEECENHLLQVKREREKEGSDDSYMKVITNNKGIKSKK